VEQQNSSQLRDKDLDHSEVDLTFGFATNIQFKKDYSYHVRFKIFTVVTMKNAVFWDVTTYGSCKSRSSGKKNWRTRKTIAVTGNRQSIFSQHAMVASYE
jgi:hypothetical protein